MTQQSAAHDALTESETQLQMIADSVPAYIGSIDSQQRYRFVNRAYVDRWGKSTDEIVGLTIRELLGEELYGKVRGSVERALSGERLTLNTKQRTPMEVMLTFDRRWSPNWAPTDRCTASSRYPKTA